MPSRTYHVYILSNAGRTVLYIGVTNDLARHLGEHRAGRADAFTTRYRATHLLWYEAFSDVNDAIAREKHLERWHREWEWTLVRETNPDLSDRTAELIHIR